MISDCSSYEGNHSAGTEVFLLYIDKGLVISGYLYKSTSFYNTPNQVFLPLIWLIL